VLKIGKVLQLITRDVNGGNIFNFFAYFLWHHFDIVVREVKDLNGGRHLPKFMDLIVAQVETFQEAQLLKLGNLLLQQVAREVKFLKIFEVNNLGYFCYFSVYKTECHEFLGVLHF
jgi:hypothetical protein